MVSTATKSNILLSLTRRVKRKKDGLTCQNAEAGRVFVNEKTTPPLILDEIPQDEQRELLEKIAMQVVKRRLTAPAILFLEMCKPLNFLGSQVLIALNPFVQAVFNTTEYQKFALIIEKDANVDLLIRLIEEFDGEEQ